jgi:hypothetical protein
LVYFLLAVALFLLTTCSFATRGKIPYYYSFSTYICFIA